MQTPCLPSPLRPDFDAGADNSDGQQQYEHITDKAALRVSHRDAPVIRIFGPYRNEVFVLRKPRHGIQEQVPVSLQAEGAIGSKCRIAVNDQAAFLVWSLVLRRDDRQ